MSVKNRYTFVKNLKGGAPLRMLLKTQAGATQAIKQGEICKLSGGNMVPLGADEAMAAIIAICDQEVRAGDLAGYRWFIVPTEHDVFEYTLDAADNPARGAALYYGGDSQTVTTTVGTNVLGNVFDHAGFPDVQGSMANGDILDRGTTIGDVTTVHMTFKKAASYAAAIQT